MDIITFIGILILLSFPIVRNVNKRMKELGDDIRHETPFQLFLFVRAQFHVPTYYLFQLIGLFLPNKKL
jgi:hypothetical protein